MACALPVQAAAPLPPTASFLPGREGDARVAAVGYRLATAAVTRCRDRRAEWGMVLQHLSQFEPSRRAGLASTYALDRGPMAIVVVAGGPAASAGIRPGDVLLALDAAPVPPELVPDAPFDAAVALARADAVDALVSAPDRPRDATLLRGGERIVLRVVPRPACAVQLRLARSAQRDAFADDRHVTLTTGLLDRLATDDQLAFVIAHEMAHVILGHAALMRAHAAQRPLERAADALAVPLMRDAGFDPVTGAAALRSVGGFHLSLFASHDDAAARTEAVRRAAAATP